CCHPSANWTIVERIRTRGIDAGSRDDVRVCKYGPQLLADEDDRPAPSAHLKCQGVLTLADAWAPLIGESPRRRDDLHRVIFCGRVSQRRHPCGKVSPKTRESLEWPSLIFGNGPPVVHSRPTLPTSDGRSEVRCAGEERRWSS